MWWIRGLPSHGEMDLTRFLGTSPPQELEGGVLSHPQLLILGKIKNRGQLATQHKKISMKNIHPQPVQATQEKIFHTKSLACY